MRLPRAIHRLSQPPGSSWRRRTVRLAAATLALNAIFWLLVSRSAETHPQLAITLDGSLVRASVGQHPAAVWDSAPKADGRLGIAITSREFEDEAGIDHIVVKALPSGTVLLRDDFSHGEPSWTLPSGWRKHAHRFLTREPTVLWTQNAVCGNCSIELALVNVRGLDVFLHATDEKNGLLLRWHEQNLAWHVVTNGHLSGAHSIAQYTPSQADLYDRFEAQLASILRRGYLDGWQFVWWYARAALPGLLLVILLGVGWRKLYPRRIRGTRPLGSLFESRRAKSAVAAIAAVAAVVAGWHWRHTRILYIAAAVALMSLAACLVVLAARELMRIRSGEPGLYDRFRAATTAIAVIAICAAAAGYSAFAARVYLEGIPHVQDDAAYLVTAKAIASGHLRIPVDPRLGRFFEAGFVEYHDGYLYPLVPGQYFAGHPALLALGHLIGAPWVVNPISSGITLGLLFLLCRELFDTATGVLAIALGAISPFARFQSASMMSHPSALLFVTASLLSLVYLLKQRRMVYAVCMGAALGALLNVRPFDATILGAYVGLVLLASARNVGWRAALRMGGVAAAASAPFVLLILCQVAVAGVTVQPAVWRFLHWLPQSIDATTLRLEDLNLQLFGWPVLPGLPAQLTVGVLLLALLVLPKTRADWFIVGWAFLYPAAYATTNWHANMFGPRYWYASLGGQLVLVARLLQTLPSLVERLSRILWPPGEARRWRWIPVSVGALPMLLVAGPLFLGTIRSFRARFIPMYSAGYNGFSTAPLRLLADHRVTKGLVFLAELPQWQDLVTGITANDISFSGDLIFARHIEGQDHVLINARPQNPPYVIVWNGTALELDRLRLDPVSNETTLIPMAKHDDPRIIGKSNIFLGMQLPGGAGLVGGLATDVRGNLYLVDSADHEVLVFDADGTLRRRLSASYSFGPGAITAGQGIAVDADSNVYVANFSPPGVVRLNADGTFAWRARQTPNGEQRLTGPIGIAMLPDGDLVVTNTDPASLHVLRRDGTFAGYYAHGAAHAELRRPFGVTVGRNRHLYVSDAELKALVEIDENGRAVRQWSLPLHPVQPFNVPYVALDPRGHAYVSDYSGSALYHARPDKAQVEVIGASETLEFPSGVTTRDGEILVVQAGWNRVVRLPLP